MEVSEQQILQWKKEYGEDSIERYEFPLAPNEKDVATGWFIKPEKQVAHKLHALYSRAWSQYVQKQPVACGEIIINECWLGGDERIKDTNSYIHISAAMYFYTNMHFLEPRVFNA
jgi:hypothetical protein